MKSKSGPGKFRSKRSMGTKAVGPFLQSPDVGVSSASLFSALVSWCEYLEEVMLWVWFESSFFPVV